MLRLRLAILTLALTGSLARAQTTTAPSANDGPAPVAMAPTYIAIGKELLLRVAIVRRTLGDLTLDSQVRSHATGILDDAEKTLRKMLTDVEAGNMPPYAAIMAVPENMRTAHQNLLAAIGPDQAQLLDEKLRSLRGEGRQEIAKLRQDVDDKKPADNVRHCCDGVLSQADGLIDKLPDTDVQGDQYAAGRQELTHVVAKCRDDLAKTLAPAEQTKIDPATRPAPHG